MSKKIKISGIWITLSCFNAVLVAFTSLSGLLNPNTYIQETSNWAMQALGQDIANLLAVIILLLTTYLLANGSKRAYLVWLGIYLYLIYAFVIYSFNVHFNYLFLSYVSILSISIFVPLGSILDGSISSFSESFGSKINVIPSVILLMFIGIMFSILWLAEIIPHIFSGTKPQGLIDTGLWTNPVHVLDLGLLLPSMIMTSIFLWRRKFIGYFLAIPLLVFSANMGIGIIVLFVLFALNDRSPLQPPAFIIGAMVILSTYFSYHFLKQFKNS